jgi:alpha-1,2-mannosyltransferase
MVGLLTCALTGLLTSPVSWDHHWVWIVPAAVVAVVYAVRARRAAVRWAAAGLATGIILVFGAWPGGLWSLPSNTGGYFEGLIWVPPVTDPELFFRLGDRPWYAEYHWHGLQLITGNLYILTGIALFALLVVLALKAARGAGPGTGGLTRAAEDPASEAVPAA